jgi:outer membrane lipoprotein-sorting protein
MKYLFSTLLVALCWCLLPSAAAPQDKAPASGSLEAVLKIMDQASANFHTTQAEFEWDRYEKVIDEVDDIQSGTIYYRRSGKDKDIEMMADITKPDRKYVLFSDGKIRVYQPKPDQVTIYDAGRNKTEVETYLVLGFGGSGEDMQKSFTVTYLGPETINGVPTAKLQLVPKSDKVRNTFAKILLWIDLDRGISVQQQFFEPQGDYRLAKYSSIKVNDRISSDVFQLKTNGKTQTISPRG